MFLALRFLVFSLWVGIFDTCEASPARSIAIKHGPERSYIPSFPQIGRPATDRSITKRRDTIRPAGSKPFSTAHTKTHTIRLFSYKFVFTDEGNEKLVDAMLKKFPQIIAAMFVGLEIEQHVIAFRIGAFTLNLYALVEALTQDIVLAVVRRLAQLFGVQMGAFLGEGVVVVGAGVRVLFAAGIRLQGLEDLNDVVVQPLMGLIG